MITCDGKMHELNHGDHITEFQYIFVVQCLKKILKAFVLKKINCYDVAQNNASRELLCYL